MTKRTKVVLLSIVAGLALAGTAGADVITYMDDIEDSTTWTSANTYKLGKQIHVVGGATLTIQSGTVVKSDAGVGGSLAVCRDSFIHIMGTADAPVIMTSSLDTMTSWHEGCNEWGNLTVMGNAIIGCSYHATNSSQPTGDNQYLMEGFTEDPYDPTDSSQSKWWYGGDDDDDDRGEIHYLSLRYGGKVASLANELNGLSLGAIGRATEIDHVEIMNNVDDGIEIWGGTVQPKYVSIWNIGDDSFDIDQGWRGKAQFGLIVQGYSANASQGSGVGDNCFETDGAEDSDSQPVTTGVIYNFTAIGQPYDGDHGSSWRDNARVQYRNCIFMDLGGELVYFKNLDGDGAHGYGYNSTLTWEQTWDADYDDSLDWTSTVNAATPMPSPGAFNHPAVLYQSQVDGKLAEITDCVFYNNAAAGAYDEADDLGVRDAGKNNVTATVSPIRNIDREDPPVVKSGKVMARVISLDPRAATNDSQNSVGAAPDDGFFTEAYYRGAFDGQDNWLAGWTAADAYGMIDTSVVNPPLAGDLDGDCFCGQNDLDIVLDAWGDSVPPGDPRADVSGDGFVGQSDLDVVLDDWGESCN